MDGSFPTLLKHSDCFDVEVWNKKDSTEKMYPNLLLRGFKLLRAECIKDWHHPGLSTFLVVSVDNNE